MAEPDLRVNSREEFDAQVILYATLFTVIWCRGRMERDREEYPTLKQAAQRMVSWTGPKRPLVYAVTKAGRSALVPPNDIEMWIQRRRE